MDAKTYLIMRGMMTGGCEGIEPCVGCCPINENHNGHNLNCGVFETRYPDEAIAIVQKWADEHPECDPDGETEADPECDPDGEKIESFYNHPILIENHGTLAINLS